ncbi:MAG: hypothetical protein K6343_03120 [Caldisericaceae bacterium]
MFAHKKLIVTIILVSLLTTIFPSQHSYKLPNVKAATVVNHWTFSDSSVHLSYDITEYQDASFVIKEYYWGSLSRTITGHAYIDIVNGKKWAKAVVDSNTTAYWDAVRRADNLHKLNDFAQFVDILLFITTPIGVITALDYIKYGLGIMSAAEEFFKKNSELASDLTKTIYEMSCASNAAWNLVNNPHVIVPSWNEPEV